ncbi:MAG: hypothetical protein C0402_05500 [Thermodesulfovibrio sp.]|nr:hypothetical protein [Thermodesulfovibrio sp.]
MHDPEERVNVVVGDGVVVLHRIGRSKHIVANILGTETDNAGAIRTIWLDRIVHKPGEKQFVGWDVSGAVATEMRKLDTTGGNNGDE